MFLTTLHCTFMLHTQRGCLNSRLYLYSPSRLSRPVLGWTLPIPGTYRYIEADGIRDMMKRTLWKVTGKISKNKVRKWDLGFLLWLMLRVRSYETKKPCSLVCRRFEGMWYLHLQGFAKMQGVPTAKNYNTIRLWEKAQVLEFICKQQVETAHVTTNYVR